MVQSIYQHAQKCSAKFGEKKVFQPLVDFDWALNSVSVISQFYKDVLEVGELARLGNLMFILAKQQA